MIFLQFLLYFYGLSSSVDSSDVDEIPYEKLLKVHDDDSTQIPKKEYSLGGFPTNVKVFFHTKCVNIYSAEEAEELLVIDGKYGQDWWKPSGDFRAGNEKYIVMCSAHPNRKNPTKVTIDQHEFFRRRNIKIPIQPGQTDTRELTFHYRRQKPVPQKQRWRLMVDCECTADAKDDLCINKKISLSRGVGGDTSFFVHELNSEGEYSVRAHICFSNSHFQKKSSRTWWEVCRKLVGQRALVCGIPQRAVIQPTPRATKMIGPSTSTT